MWRFKANRAYHCIWVIAKHPDLKQLLGFAIAQFKWLPKLFRPVLGLLRCHDMLLGSLLAEHHISEGEASAIYFQLLVFIMPLPQRSLRLSLLQATALLALGIPPIVTLGWNYGGWYNKTTTSVVQIYNYKKQETHQLQVNKPSLEILKNLLCDHKPRTVWGLNFGYIMITTSRIS